MFKTTDDVAYGNLLMKFPKRDIRRATGGTAEKVLPTILTGTSQRMEE
jgi:hypothetical protein